MDHTAAFLATPIPFLQNRMLFSTLDNPSGPTPVSVIDFEHAPLCQPIAGGAIVAPLKLENPPAAAPLNAMWLQWQEDGLTHVDIDNTVDFLFTYQMDGCSLAIREPVLGQRRVCHANDGQAGVDGWNASPAANDIDRAWEATTAQLEGQEAQIRAHFAAADRVHIISPTLYRIDPDVVPPQFRLKSTTFGIRNPNDDTWDFYLQRYALDAAGVIYRFYPVVHVISV